MMRCVCVHMAYAWEMSGDWFSNLLNIVSFFGFKGNPQKENKTLPTHMLSLCVRWCSQIYEGINQKKE